MKNVIDTAQLARDQQTLSGERTIEDLPRLATLLASSEGGIAWRVRGWRGDPVGGGHDDFLELVFSATVYPACVRCLAPVAVQIDDTKRFRLVESEAQAEHLDLDDDEYDVLAGGARFDLAALIEDEAILALPPMPRHERCEPARALREEVSADEEAENPFAALRRLRRGGPDGGGETPH